MNKHSQQRGAVLVVALIMLAMITFLVVAFVGFARFERSSVSAAMRRTEAGFLMGDALALAQKRAIEDIALVSNNAAGPASLQGLMVSRRNPMRQGDWAPVYIDTDNDGVQDLNSTYLNLNAEINAGGMGDPYFQATDPAKGIVGDPEWLGVLADPTKPHSVENRYLARMAYMTVPVSRALSLRYNHFITNWGALDQVRGEGEGARSLDLAAPLYHIDPVLFGQSRTSARKFVGAFYELGGAVGDAIHFSRPSPGFNQVMGENMAPGLSGAIPRKYLAEWLSDVTNPKIFSLSEWFTSDGQGRKPYGFYEFMETFSAAKLPDERRGFDISQIRDEVSYGFAYPFSTNIMKTLKPHGLKDGVKLEFVGGKPSIKDPIEFPLISSDYQNDDEMKQAWIDLIGSGGPMMTRAPHRLMPNDWVKVRVSGINDGLQLIHRANAAAPWVAATTNAVIKVINTNNPNSFMETWSRQLSPVSPFKISNQNQVQLGLGFNGDVAWGQWNAALGQYNVLLNISDPDPNALLPAGLAGARCDLVYRENVLLADSVPYYVKVFDEKSFSLHRSAELDDFSRVDFGGVRAGVIGNFDFQSATGRCAVDTPHPFLHGDYVCFNIRPPQRISISNPAQGTVDSTHVFQLVQVNPNDRSLFGLKVVEGPYKGQYLRLANNGIYRLRLVHRLQHDRLNENVERMAGLMLNESLDVDDTVTPQRFLLGEVELPVPNPANPFPLQLGIGGDPESMGPWHAPEAGVPWGGANSFSGSYTPEVERILQVAANIGDLYSEPGNYESIRGKDIITCDNTTNSFPALLPFHRAVSDGLVSAKIQYTWGRANANGQLNYNKAGLAFGEYSVSFTPLSMQPPYKVRGRVVLKKSGVEIAHSAPVDVALTQGNDNGGQWEWSLNKFVWRDGLNPIVQNNSWVGMDLGLELESGRFVRVYLGGRKVIEYESTTRSVPGQMGVWVAPNTKAYVTSVMPGISRPQLPPGGVNGWRLLYSSLYPWGSSGNMPTLYQGHFRRDRDNNVFLTGIQRTTSPASLPSPQNPSWYLRGAPNLLGVKDRNGTYAGRMPSISEANLRFIYNRSELNLDGSLGSLSSRLYLETDVPVPNIKLHIKGLRVRYDVEAIYKNSKTGAVIHAPIVPVDFVPPTINGTNITLNGTGYLCTVLADTTLDGKGLLTVKVPRGRVLQGVGSPLHDIRIKNIKISINAFLIGNNGRIVDFFTGDLEKNDLSLKHSRKGQEFYAPVWDPQVALNNGYGGAGNPQVVLYPPPNGTTQWNPQYWTATSNTATAPKSQSPSWSVGIDGIRQLRKVDCSWQVNDPLVNGRTHDWRNRVYKLIWMSVSKLDQSLKQGFTLSSVSFGPNNVVQYVGFNICKINDESRYWGRPGSSNDLTFKDPGVGNHWWTFPDIRKGGVQTVGWLGQVHRGTPWQTLYMKSKEPGKKPIVAFDNANGFLTVPSHSFTTGQYLGVRGRRPLAWANVQTNAFGLIAAGQLTGYAQVIGNQIRLWPSAGPNSWLAGTDLLSGIGAAQTLSGLELEDVNGTSWSNWAGSSDTKPQNDRRLFEVFEVSGGKPLRGNFSVNNSSEKAWSSVLHGISIPPHASVTGVPSREIGANSLTGRNGEIRADYGANDTRWNRGLLKGIFDKKANSGGRFSRIMDILSVPALTDESPFLPNVLGVQNLNQYYDAVSKVDELDIERIPQQIMSLLKVGGPQRYQTYIFMEQLRPARSYNIMINGAPTAQPGVGGGVVSNYEVVSQNAVRVLYDIEGADAWANSLKRGHFGKMRTALGTLVPLPAPKPRIIETLPIHLDN